MKNLLLCFICLLTMNLSEVIAQDEKQMLPEFFLEKAEMEMHMRFLASDELMGRRTTEQGNNTAARYIAEQFRYYGVKQVDGADGYYQKIPFENRKPPKEGMLVWENETYLHGKNMVILAGDSIKTESEVVFVNFGWVDEDKGIDDYKDLDVKGKIVVALSGLPDTQDPGAVFGSMKTKRALASEKGAIAMIELYKLSFPWQFFKNYFGKARVDIASDKEEDGPGIPYIWIKEETPDAGVKIKNGDKSTMKIKSSGFETQPLPSQNVVGMIEGTDPVLKNEYLLVTAHYDHVGTGKKGGGAFTAEDSIFNGARDNAMGVISMLAAAKSLAKKPTKRSVIFVAFTAEEMGLLGSAYYSEHPLVPLKQTVFNLNTDGAGYDDKTAYSVIGYDRVGVKSEFDEVAKKFDLKILPDPAPDQNLFDRSDNVNFAKLGIPAPTVSPGTSGFTSEIMKYYHQNIDNPESVDFDYLLVYCKVFAHLTRKIGNKAQAPRWKVGDKYEAAGKKLYGY